MAPFDLVAPGVYRVRDLVNVYVLVRDGCGLAVEMGRGQALDHLDAIGVERLEWVLHTHHHRDLCMGDTRAVSAGAKVAVPESEAELFENAQACWEAWQIYVNYDLRSRRDCRRVSGYRHRIHQLGPFARGAERKTSGAGLGRVPRGT